MYSAEDEAFRTELRTWLRDNLPAGWMDAVDRGESLEMSADDRKAFNESWPEKLFGGGWICATWPKEYGGKGLTTMQGVVLAEEFARAKAPMRGDFFGDTLVGPTLLQWGTEEQKKEFLPKILSGQMRWCQGFSEPNSGSDLASLKTSAVLDGDEWVINGQKVWTTLAHVCDYGVIIARTNPEAPKHAGISMFIVDMRAPGVEIRPIHQIDGGSHFNEIFLTDVRIPKSWLLGELNNGWNQATAMLMFERVAIGTGSSSGVSHVLADRLIEVAKRNGKISDPVVRQELMKIYCEESTKSMVSMRTRAEMKAGKVPGPGGSLGKLHGARIAWASRPLISRLVGPDSDAWEPGGRGENWARQILNSFQSSIAGGTDEIQRNIIGDRVLGLPREPMVDKDLPFKDLKVGTQR